MNRYFEFAKVLATIAGFFAVASGIFFSISGNILTIFAEENRFAVDLASKYPNYTQEILDISENIIGKPLQNNISKNEITATNILYGAIILTILAFIFAVLGFLRESKNPFWKFLDY